MRAVHVGATLGAIPQVVLCVAAARILLTASSPADPVIWGIYAVLAYFVMAVLVSVTAGVLCLISETTRPFGRGLLSGTGLGAIPFVVITALAMLS